MGLGADRLVALPSAPRIALIKLGALGDLLYAFPLVSALKTARPAARLTWIVEERFRDVPRLHPGVDQVLTIDTRRWRHQLRRREWRAVWTELTSFRRLVRGQFDVALDVQGLMKSAAVAWITRAPVRIGFARADCREALGARGLTHQAAPAGAVHVVRKNMGLLTVLGLPTEPVRFQIAIQPADDWWVHHLFALHGIEEGTRTVLLHPGAGHPAKRWPVSRFIEVAEQLAGCPAVRLLWTAGPDESGLLQSVAERLPRSLVVTPPGIGTLAALVRRCSLVIAGDTGPLHLAAALGRPTVALYGPSDPLHAGPAGVGHQVLKHPCPCGWTPGPFFNRRCPDPPCMQAIQVEEVLAAMDHVLGAPAVCRPVW
jgi:lipopolysaccharide heptosyltransferase I